MHRAPLCPGAPSSPPCAHPRLEPARSPADAEDAPSHVPVLADSPLKACNLRTRQVRLRERAVEGWLRPGVWPGVPRSPQSGHREYNRGFGRLQAAAVGWASP